MCGIFGFFDCDCQKTFEEAYKIILNGLSDIEYRGYDNTGACIFRNDSLIVYRKVKGNVNELKNRLDKIFNNEVSDLKGSRGRFMGISHTRTASHGDCSARNSHPIRSDLRNTFFVVHNGIITNFREIKDELEALDHIFETETDSEVAAKLLLHFYVLDETISFLELAKLVIMKFKGESAFLFLSLKYPGEMIVIHNGNPAFLGLNECSNNIKSKNLLEFGSADIKEYSVGLEQRSEILISSDYEAIQKYSNKIIFGNTGVIMHITVKSVGFHYFNSEKFENTEQSGFNTNYKESEIESQIAIIDKLINLRINFENYKIEIEGIEQYLDRLKKFSRIFLVANDFSYFACDSIKKTFEKLTGKLIKQYTCEVFMERKSDLVSDDFVIMVDPAGTSLRAIEALRFAKEIGSTRILLTDNFNSIMTKMATSTLSLEIGEQENDQNTKTFTAVYINLLLIALYISQENQFNEEIKNEIIYEMISLKEKLKISKLICLDDILAEKPNINEIYLFSDSFISAKCLEALMKVKNLKFIQAKGINFEKIARNSKKIKEDCIFTSVSIKADDFQSQIEHFVLICNENNCFQDKNVIIVPKTVECLQGFISIIPLQKISSKLNQKDCLF